MIGPTGTGWPGADDRSRPRWSDDQLAVRIAEEVAVAARTAKWAVLQAVGELESSTRQVAADGHRKLLAALRAAQEDEIRASGKPVWIGVENMTREERRVAYRALIDSWEVWA